MSSIDYMPVPPPHHRRYIPHPADHPYFGGAAARVGHAPAGRGLDANALRSLIVAALAGHHADPGLVPGHWRDRVLPVTGGGGPDMPLPTRGGEYFPGPVGVPHIPDIPVTHIPDIPGGGVYGPGYATTPSGAANVDAVRAAVLAALMRHTLQAPARAPARRFAAY
jgi:hypothetical protein